MRQHADAAAQHDGLRIDQSLQVAKRHGQVFDRFIEQRHGPWQAVLDRSKNLMRGSDMADSGCRRGHAEARSARLKTFGARRAPGLAEAAAKAIGALQQPAPQNDPAANA
ncbi:hypothetical protein D9M68_899690 [compost metagenome]